MTKKTIGILVGSLRKESYSKKVALKVSDLLAEEFKIKFIELSELTMYNQDVDTENDTPKSWVSFRKEVQSVDAVLFVTPEYNRSIPPVLKNALDIGSRPYGESAWSKKPGGIISVSPSQMGGIAANHALRQAVVFLDIYMMQQPEAYFSNAGHVIDENGNITDERSNELLQKFANSFIKWVSKF
jgi:chromate reductase